MSAAVDTLHSADYTEVRHVVRSGVQLGILQSVLVGLFALVSRWLSGPGELVGEAFLLVIGVAITVTLPGLRTNARTIEGIAGAAGIGLMATATFLVVDVVLFQPLGLYTSRWLAIGGGSNWWYHPVWFMIGTYMAWMGAWALANQAARPSGVSPAEVVGGTIVLAVLWMVGAVLLKVPGATWGVGTFAVAILPAQALLVMVTWLGARRR